MNPPTSMGATGHKYVKHSKQVKHSTDDDKLNDDYLKGWADGKKETTDILKKKQAEFIEKLKDMIKSEDWIEYSNGRSTDYADEFCSEWSIKELIEELDKLAKENGI